MKYTLPVIGFLMLIAILSAVFDRSSDDVPPVTSAPNMYCAPDGTLIDTQTIQSHRSYCIRSSSGETAFAPGVAAPYAFTIVDDQGSVLKDFATVHTKMMHVIAVRKDLGEFQHVHPEYDPATGVFTLSDLILPTSGEYRIFADFTPGTGQVGHGGMPLGVTIYEDVVAGEPGAYAPKLLGTDTRAEQVDGYQVSLRAPQPLRAQAEQVLSFEIARDGQAVIDLQEYLGALGHAVVLREGTLDFIHAHPLERVATSGRVDFAVTFPREGTYKLFSQFQHEGRVLTAGFVVSVAEGAGTGTIDHSMMGHE